MEKKFAYNFSTNLKSKIQLVNKILKQRKVLIENNNITINHIKQKFNKIHHVYQETYKFNSNASGFGDFIRGCFFIIQFCSKFNFEYEIIINHPISKYFKMFSSKDYNTDLNNNVQKFSITNLENCVYDEQNYIKNFKLKNVFNKFINYLYSLPVINNSVFSYNNLFPYYTINNQTRNSMRILFEPTSEINEKINKILFNLQLIKNNYCVLHIRSGDSYLIDNNKQFTRSYIKIITNEINKIICNNKNINILLISDNNTIKFQLNKIFPNIKLLIHDITHVGQGVELQEEKVRNTIIDFFLMSNSSFILSITCYPHGSGFSYWCSEIFGIPYKCKFIKDL